MQDKLLPSLLVPSDKGGKRFGNFAILSFRINARKEAAPRAASFGIRLENYSASARALASSMTFCWTLPGASS